jgi:hypothetical protein
MITVEVIVENFGTHAKGDKIQMERSTAEACINSKVVKIPTKAKSKKSK